MDERIKMDPTDIPLTVRTHRIKNPTSGRAGKIIPVAVAPTLREDAIRGRIRISVEMAETAETLLNAVNVTAHAYFVPHMAFERFGGSQLHYNKSYMNSSADIGGQLVTVPFFTTHTFTGNHQFYKTLGFHAPANKVVNGAYLEAYNTLVNYMRRARSSKLSQRHPFNTDLAEAFWHSHEFGDVVPDFDSAMIDGEVELQLLGQARVSGLGGFGTALNAGQPPLQVVDYDGPVNYQRFWNGTAAVMQAAYDGNQWVPNVMAELAGAGASLTLQNIERAKKTVAWAKAREAYSGITDDDMIDLLLQGVRVPEEAMANPILLDRRSTIVGYTKRYATDAANLDESVTTGETVLDLAFRTPPMNVNGYVVVIVQTVPEQFFERQEDPLLFMTDPDDFPNPVRDILDPEKVEVVTNSMVDVKHSDPNGTFGYRGLNSKWNIGGIRPGGKFYKESEAFDEDRQRLWINDTVDPALTSNFYLVNGLTETVFADAITDPFEFITLGQIDFIGRTQFGKRLSENTGDYDAVDQIAEHEPVVQS